jgi:hypothetical protein
MRRIGAGFGIARGSAALGTIGFEGRFDSLLRPDAAV